jgi:hypothetical protein
LKGVRNAKPFHNLTNRPIAAVHAKVYHSGRASLPMYDVNHAIENFLTESKVDF